VCFTTLFRCAATHFAVLNCAGAALGVSTPLFNALSINFAVMNCSVLALSAVFCSGLLTWSADIIYVYYNDTFTTTSKESACRIICMLCQQTSPKRWFANVNMTSRCDVASSVYTVTMTTIRHCSILDLNMGGIQSSSRLGHHQTTPLNPCVVPGKCKKCKSCA